MAVTELVPPGLAIKVIDPVEPVVFKAEVKVTLPPVESSVILGEVILDRRFAVVVMSEAAVRFTELEPLTGALTVTAPV